MNIHAQQITPMRERNTKETATTTKPIKRK